VIAAKAKMIAEHLIIARIFAPKLEAVDPDLTDLPLPLLSQLCLIESWPLMCSHVVQVHDVSTCVLEAAMSALPPKADILRACWDVGFVPKVDSCSAAKILMMRQGSMALF
jgi:hypothetical protein